MAEPLRETVIARAQADLDAEPVTVTASYSDRSAGGPHDFFSQADYFWPDPANPDGPYKGRDGQTNPDNFNDHRLAMIRFSQIVGELTSAWLISGDQKYADAVVPHLRAWFMDEDTYMAPHLLYSQAVLGRDTGRSIGIIDSIHLMEVAQSVRRLEQAGAIPREVIDGTKDWFAKYIGWLTSHPYGIAEMRAANNHGTCWAMQTACFARLTGNQEVMDLCRKRFKEVFLPGQMAPDGSFPMETSRTKPYGYSIFNMDALATLCQILSTPQDDLWEYVSEEGNCMLKGVRFITPYVADKERWPLAHDIMYWDEWPVAQPYLVFAWWHWKDAARHPAADPHRRVRDFKASAKRNGAEAEEWFGIWERLEHFPTNQEVIRNLPVRNPLLWLE